MKTLLLAALLSTLAVCPALSAQSPSPTRNEFPLFVKVQLDRSVKLTSLKTGDSVDGKLTRDVYSPEDRVFAAGSQIRLTVSRVERKRKTRNDSLPWIAKAFLPHDENSPVFSDAAISMPDGSKSEIEALLLSSSRMKAISLPLSRDAGKKSANIALIETHPTQRGLEEDASPSHGPVLYLEAHQTIVKSIEPPGWVHSGPSSSSVLPAGTACRVLLLDRISASNSHMGDEIHARLLEPILSDSRVVIPAGSMFEGRVMKATRPRAPSRAGSLAIGFESVRLPEGQRIAVSASLTSVDVNAGSPIKMDGEAGIHGSRPGAVWMLINGGVTAGIAKEVDDGTQLIVEAIISTATDVSTAGTARIAGSLVSAAFMLTRKGNDVVLPDHTEMVITLNRPLTFSAQMATVSSSNGETRSTN